MSFRFSLARLDVLLYLAGRHARPATGAGYSGQFARTACAGPLSAARLGAHAATIPALIAADAIALFVIP
jgi:hypothetical protein